MRTYHQLTSGERYALSALRKQGFSQGQIARTLDRAPSTISREVRRNSKDGGGRVYRPALADDIARWRRSRSRRNRRSEWEDWVLIAQCLQEEWSPEQIAGRFKRDGLMSISHETIYRYVRTTGDGAALYTGICAALPNNAENGTDTTIPEVGSRASGRYLSVQLEHRTEAKSVTSKPIP